MIYDESKGEFKFQAGLPDQTFIAAADSFKMWLVVNKVLDRVYAGVKSSEVKSEDDNLREKITFLNNRHHNLFPLRAEEKSRKVDSGGMLRQTSFITVHEDKLLIRNFDEGLIRKFYGVWKMFFHITRKKPPDLAFNQNRSKWGQVRI